MKFIRRSFYALASLALLSACSSDEPMGNVPSTDENGEGFYMALTVQMPGASTGRSATDDKGDSNSDANPDTEVGQDDENKVNNVFVVLAEAKTNKLITCGEISGSKLSPLANNSYKNVTKISKSALAAYYESTTNREINVFVFCNPDTKFAAKVAALSTGDDTWFNEAGTLDVDDAQASLPWADKAFMMSNSEIATRSLPKDINDWNDYKTESSAFNLSGWNKQGTDKQVDNATNRGAVKVERTAARFDFKDASEKGDQTYDVIFGQKADGTQGDCFVQVKLNRMALANMSKKYYYLRRVSAAGTPADMLLCGVETPTNYVVSPNYQPFQNVISSGFDTYFNYPFFVTNGAIDPTQNKWNAYAISDVLGGKSDNWDKKEYHIWRYVTENAIPAPTTNQTYDRTTIVAFKGKMIGTPAAISADSKEFGNIADVANALNGTRPDGTKLTGNPSEDPIIYQFAGALYLTWNGVRQAVIDQAVTVESRQVPDTSEGANPGATKPEYYAVINRNNSLYSAVYGNGGMGAFTVTLTDGTELSFTDELAKATGTADAAWTAWNADKTEENLAAMRAAVTGANFTIYQSSLDPVDGAGYYCYYYYRNRHNDNGDEGNMGVMEFAVVRNNVYKLAVTKIHQLGHPRNSANDPDSPHPGTPDESDELYFTVTCQVLPWTVRVNNIEF